VLWRREFPRHPIFKDPLFQTAEYKAFELSVYGALAMAVDEDSHSLAIQKAVPALNDRLRTMTGVIQNGQVTHAQALRSLEGIIASKVSQLTSAIDDFVGGSFTCQFVPRSQGQGQAYAGPWALPFTGAATGPLAPAPLPLTALAKASSSVPEYSMSRTIQTIPELWQEWTMGLHGQPSIERLDELYGSRWRTGPGKASERQFYSRRKTLITEIRRLAAAQGASQGGDPYKAVIAQLEEQRKQAGASLSKVIDTLKQAHV
jgi:Transcriptional activator of glycolytic enzymes